MLNERRKSNESKLRLRFDYARSTNLLPSLSFFPFFPSLPSDHIAPFLTRYSSDSSPRGGSIRQISNNPRDGFDHRPRPIAEYISPYLFSPLPFSKRIGTQDRRYARREARRRKNIRKVVENTVVVHSFPFDIPVFRFLRFCPQGVATPFTFPRVIDE